MSVILAIVFIVLVMVMNAFVGAILATLFQDMFGNDDTKVYIQVSDSLLGDFLVIQFWPISCYGIVRDGRLRNH